MLIKPQGLPEGRNQRLHYCRVKLEKIGCNAAMDVCEDPATQEGSILEQSIPEQIPGIKAFNDFACIAQSTKKEHASVANAKYIIEDV